MLVIPVSDEVSRCPDGPKTLYHVGQHPTQVLRSTCLFAHSLCCDISCIMKGHPMILRSLSLLSASRQFRLTALPPGFSYLSASPALSCFAAVPVHLFELVYKVLQTAAYSMSPCGIFGPLQRCCTNAYVACVQAAWKTQSVQHFSIASGKNIPVSRGNSTVSLAQHLRSLADGSQGRLCSSERAAELMAYMLLKQPSCRCSR